jgi:hypothetical protein
MEVHAHTHTARKKWTHYFWEFLMLFLAVFCGFLAEFKLEHTIEHNREKDYVTALINDLEKDTLELRSAIESNSNRKETYDSLWRLLKQPDPFQNISLLYYYFVPTTYYYPFNAAEGTIRQLENAGGLRLIRKKNAVDSITAYYSYVRASVGQLNTFLRYFDQYHEVAFTVFDYSQIDTLFYSRKNILNAGRNFTLLTNDKTTLKILFNKLYALWFIVQSYLNFLELVEEQAIATLIFLKKEYHLE